MFQNDYSSEYMQIIIVSIADLLVCLIIGLKRGLLVHLPAEMLIKVAPYLILYCTPIEMGFLTLSSLAFLVFICGRHLRLVSKIRASERFTTVCNFNTPPIKTYLV